MLGLPKLGLEWSAPACHPERQRGISHDGQRDPSLALRMTMDNRFVSPRLMS